MLARIIWMDGAEARRRTPYRLPCRTISGSSSESFHRRHHNAVTGLIYLIERTMQPFVLLFHRSEILGNESNLRHPAPECRSARRQCQEYGFGRPHARPPSRCRAPYCPRSPARRIRSLRGYGIASVHHAFSPSEAAVRMPGKCCSAPDDEAAEYRYNEEGQNQSADRKFIQHLLQNIRNAALIQFKTVHRNRYNPVLRLQLVAYTLCRFAVRL